MTASTTDVAVGSSLASIANSSTGDYSVWRNIATLNNINIFQPLTVGQTIKLPSSKDIQNSINAKAVSSLNTALAKLDLSSINKGLPTAIATNEWRLISWIL